MKIQFLLIILLSLLSLSINAHSVKKEKIKEKAAETKFLRQVESAVKVHDADQLMKFMEPSYKRTQHDEFLEGRTVQFLNEFFCSVVIFNEITDARLIRYSLISGSKTEYEVEFFLKSAKKESNCIFYMHKNLTSKTFSIYSAVG